MEDQLEKNTADKNNIDELSQYVTFKIDNEMYGVEVLRVHEIVGITKITHVPNSMEFMKGVINLRGNVVPVIDIRLKFNMDPRDYDDTTVILIVELKEYLVGLVVDTVSDVISISSQEIQDTPHFSTNIDTDFIQGVGNKDDNLVIILDVNRILSSAEFEKISEKQSA